jgi:hypothetical protein
MCNTLRILVKFKMITNFNSSYMTMISLTYISCFSVKFSFNRFVPILNILRGKYYHKIFCSETWDAMIFNPRWLALLLAEISIGKKIRIGWNFYMKFRSQIENCEWLQALVYLLYVIVITFTVRISIICYSSDICGPGL